MCTGKKPVWLFIYADLCVRYEGLAVKLVQTKLLLRPWSIKVLHFKSHPQTEHTVQPPWNKVSDTTKIASLSQTFTTQVSVPIHKQKCKQFDSFHELAIVCVLTLWKFILVEQMHRGQQGHTDPFLSSRIYKRSISQESSTASFLLNWNNLLTQS